MPLNRCEPKEGVGPGMSVQTVLQQSETSRKMQILFFPNGSCKSLKRTECVRHMCDFAQNRIFSECSIQKVYEKNKLKILRLYLCTKRTSPRQQSHEVVHQEQENQTTVQMQNPIDVQDDSEVTYQEQENKNNQHNRRQTKITDQTKKQQFQMCRYGTPPMDGPG